jgi:acyl-CoA synthetase (AMP-forming)/AMP-acid ligase II
MPSALVESFARVCRDRGSAPLLHAPSEGRTLTAHDITREAGDIRQAFRQAGLARGHLVISAIGNHATFVALTLACLADGLPLLPADRGTPVAEAEALASRWQGAALVLPQGSRVTASAATVPLPGGLEVHVRHDRPAGPCHGAACLLKLTSGSSGTPKATLTREAHLEADVRHITASMGIGPETRQLGVIPLSHSYGFSNLVLPLLWQGSPLLLRPGFVPTQIAPDVAAFSLHTWAGVPFMFDHMAAHVPHALPPTLRTCISAGARLDAATVRAFHARTGLKIHSFYGSSETGGICFDGTDELHEPVPVGRPMGDTRVTLRPDEGAPTGSGRIVVHGPAVVDGYADEEDAGGFAEGGYVTSDFGQFSPDGLLVLTGRSSTFVNVAGRKVLPAEVEAALRELPGVRDSAVAAVADARRGEAIGACVVADERIVPAVLRARLAGRLAAYKLPRVIVQVESIPVTDRGKIDRAAVAALLAAAADSGVTAPRGDR